MPTANELKADLLEAAERLAELVALADEMFGWKVSVSQSIMGRKLELDIKETLLDWREGS